ncbi:HAMP domain-containing sensor histidine kinase [Marinomonas sp. 15G1-11]|uniref:histidine kinase n=1 Tax=Marinomonas phaeophyticola TaxID=3004091 RepID=A0ABT4JRP3_9GAMM|nr:HAMP domain-containing sensor histidine kinase [Marinomonas sp. 15G1-11]MCZ2721009.1 HAMP domain-containing sensor histidine kinase [Marinomonas sp. 15G1-11]
MIFRFSEEFIEEYLIYPQLSFELNRFVKSQQNIDISPPGMSFYNESTIPTSLKHFQPQNNLQETEIEGKEVTLIVANINGQKYMVIDNKSIFEDLESAIEIILILASFFSILSAWLFSKLSTRSVIAPLSIMVKEIESDAERLHFSITSTDEIGTLARAIEERNARLQDFLERERVFSSDTSHELRTPLTVILGATEVLLANLTGQPKLLNTVNRIKRTTIETTEQVSALLLLSRSPERLSYSTVQIERLIQEQRHQCEYLLESKPVSFNVHIQDTVEIRSQPELISVVLRNLFKNACQHTEQGSISVQLCKDKLIIEDTGSGIGSDSQVLLFDRSNNASSQTGYGFGLSIVKRIIDQLHWNIQFETPHQGGSRFIVFFMMLTKPHHKKAPQFG